MKLSDKDINRCWMCSQNYNPALIFFLRLFFYPRELKYSDVLRPLGLLTALKGTNPARQREC